MTTLYGLAGINATEYQYIRDMNQGLLYDAVSQYIGMASQASMWAASLFVDPTPTQKDTEYYILPSTGQMQEVSEETTSSPVSRTGGWEVAYPLKNYMDSIAGSDVDLAYMSPAVFQAHIEGINARAKNTMRNEILYRILNNTTDTYTNRRDGTITVRPLAIGSTDSVLYPPVEGSDDEATDDHYLESGYAASAIDDTSNPFATLVTELVQHGTNTTDDIPVVALINSAQQTKTEALTNFVPYIPPQISRGADTDQVLMPSKPVPGKVIGYIRGQCWVSVWDWVPANYIVGVNLAAPPPLKKRIDSAPGLGDGQLSLISMEREGVVNWRNWRLRFGIGTSNRLGAAVMELGTGGTYTIPTAYQ